jgi:hypothetical protein
MKIRILILISIITALFVGAALALTLPVVGKTVLLLENQTEKPFHYVEIRSGSGEFHRIVVPLVIRKEKYKIEPLQRADSFIFRVLFEDKSEISSKSIPIQLGDKKRITLRDSGIVIGEASFWDIISQRNRIVPGRIIMEDAQK